MLDKIDNLIDKGVEVRVGLDKSALISISVLLFAVVAFNHFIKKF